MRGVMLHLLAAALPLDQGDVGELTVVAPDAGLDVVRAFELRAVWAIAEVLWVVCVGAVDRSEERRVGKEC